MTARLRRHKAVLALALVWAAYFVPAETVAHVNIDVGDGRYVMEVGFRDEPAFLGLPNAIFVQVAEYATGGTQPVDGLAETLTAEISRDGKTLAIPLVPQGDGIYEAAFVPTATGDYTLRISGTIGDAPVDESVASGPTTFNSVQPLDAIAFPEPVPDPARVQAAAAAAQSAADSARLLAIAGIVAGVFGLVAGGLAFARSGGARPVSSETPLESTGKLIR